MFVNTITCTIYLILMDSKQRFSQFQMRIENTMDEYDVNGWMELQKEIKDNLRIESQASWEKFCNDISSEMNHTES